MLDHKTGPNDMISVEELVSKCGGKFFMFFTKTKVKSNTGFSEHCIKWLLTDK